MRQHLLAILAIAACSSGGDDPTNNPPPPPPPPSPVASVVVTGASRVKVGDDYQYAAVLTFADGGVGQRAITWTATGGTVTTAGLFRSSGVGAMSVAATSEGVTGSAAATSYDWVTFSDAGTVGAGIDADNTVTDRFGTVDRGSIVFGCVDGTYVFGIGTGTVITNTGLMSYSINGAVPTAEVWSEVEPDFNAFSHPGLTNAARKAFAQRLVGARTVTVTFLEWTSLATKTLTFRVTGAASAMAAGLAACPSNNVVALAAQIERAVMKLVQAPE